VEQVPQLVSGLKSYRFDAKRVPPGEIAIATATV
jgi:hypothetical protein